MKMSPVKWNCLLLLILFPLLLFGGNPNQKQRVYLSGIDNEHTVNWDFYCTGGRNSGFWTTIPVPSCWEQMGFGTYDYGRDSFNYGADFEFSKEKGKYKTHFFASTEWAKKEVVLVFEGSMTDTEVKLNGKLTGPVHQGSFYRFTYVVSDKIEWGKTNTLEVEVSKWSADSSVNEAERTSDYWIFGGIFRPVYLEISPKEHIERVAVRAEASGLFQMETYPKNCKAGCEILAEIMDPLGKQIAQAKELVKEGDTLVNLKCNVANVQTWTSETPVMYKVNYYLKSKGKEVFNGSTAFGFRTVEIRRGDGVYINGKKIKFKGINRHVWWPETGRSVNRNIDVIDVKLIKEMNMNAIRCSHYPPDQSFLDVCDSMGLYVIDELAGWQDAYSTHVGAPLVKEMVIRDVNHPSIVFWSNGNEGGTNKELDDDYGMYDPWKRFVIHAHYRPGNEFNGIDCNHYENYASTTKILSDSLIFMPTEFLHCQDDGGGGAGLQDFWELMWKSPKSAGGFLWAFIDEGVVRTDLNNIVDVDGVNAGDGVLGPHREKEGSFFAIRDIFSPVIITNLSLKNNSLQFKVENRFTFTSLEKCSFTWEGVIYPKPWERKHGYQKISGGSFTIALKPGEQKNIEQTTEVNNADALILEAFDPFGNSIRRWVVKITPNETYVERFVQHTKTDSIKISVSDTTIILNSSKVQLTFSKSTGLLTDVKTKQFNKLNFKNGPVLVIGNSKLLNYSINADNDTVKLSFNFEGTMQYIRWKFYPDSWLQLDYSYKAKGKMPFCGVSFDYPEAHVQTAKWLGNGPYRVWKNRPQGAWYNVWENAYNNTQTGSSPWIYPEFKGYFSNVSWMELKTVESKIYMLTPDENLFVRLFDFYAMPGIKPYPELPNGNVSFLDCIPPVGTKMAVRIDRNAAVNGPMSEMNQLDNTFEHTLYFYFGILK